jgi:mannitol-1-phosphate 5-dehydrogenase
MTKSALMFGAGNVGRGFLGQLFSESGYDVVFVDIDEPLIAALNTRRGYTIRLVEDDWTGEITVAPVRALHAEETDAVARALAEADLAATAVGVRALPHIAPLVAAGVARRDEEGVPAPLNIIVCENLKDAAAFFRRMVGDHLPAAHQAYLRTHVGFVDTVIGRMVPPPTPQMRAQDPSLIVVEPYKELPVDRRGFVGPIPEIVGLEPTDNFAVYTARKLYIHNCGHAMLGYLGHLRGHAFGYQALEDAAIRPLFERALAESKHGIATAHVVDPAWLEAHIGDVTRRLANRALGDTIFRLAHDPLRKLGPEDRLVGAARLVEKAGGTPEALSWGIAGGYCFDDTDDPLAVTLQQRIAAEGLDAVLADVSGIGPDEPLAALVRERYRRLQAGAWP